MTWQTAVFLALGGALGTLARFGVGLYAAPFSQSMPWGTIVINIIGSFVIGLVGTLTLAGGRLPLSDNLRVFLMVGVCGGFTTFSSFSLQTLDLLRAGSPTRAIINIVLSVMLCLGAVAAGHAIASHLNGDAGRSARSAMDEKA